MNQTDRSDRHSFEGMSLSVRTDFPAAPELVHPREVLAASQLTAPEKREILASWASDARAVSNAPGLRRLENGAIVKLDDVLKSLSILDAADENRTQIPSLRQPYRRRRSRPLRWFASSRRRRSWDDDDDPPPAPAAAGVPLSAAVVSP